MGRLDWSAFWPTSQSPTTQFSQHPRSRCGRGVVSAREPSRSVSGRRRLPCAEEVRTEARLLKTTEAELALHAKDRTKAYAGADPQGLARSLPGFGEVGTAILVAAIGRPGRFSKGKWVRSFCDLTPKSSETGETDRKGQPLTKAGPSLLRTMLMLAADTARKQDPQLARIYYLQMTSAAAHTSRRSAWSPPT